MDDLFLKIIAGEIPAVKVYENEHTLAFMDIKPAGKGHVLVVPKQRFRNIFDIDEAAWGHMARTARTVAAAVRNAVGADGLNIIMNNEPAGGQEVFHAHLHLVPRWSNDKTFQPARHVSYETGEMERVAEAIRAELKST